MSALDRVTICYSPSANQVLLATPGEQGQLTTRDVSSEFWLALVNVVQQSSSGLLCIRNDDEEIIVSMRRVEHSVEDNVVSLKPINRT